MSCESENILITRGPYNKAFRLKDIDGFAIDVKPRCRTLIGSGVIGIKVAGHFGDRLVFMDLRHGLGGRNSIQQSDESTSKDPILAGTDIPEAFDKGHEVALGLSVLGWNRILGIYDVDDKVLR